MASSDLLRLLQNGIEDYVERLVNGQFSPFQTWQAERIGVTD